MIAMGDYELIISRLDKKLGFGMAFQGVLAEEIAKFHLKGRLRKDIIRYYADAYNITQKELNKMVKDRE